MPVLPVGTRCVLFLAETFFGPDDRGKGGVGSGLRMSAVAERACNTVDFRRFALVTDVPRPYLTVSAGWPRSLLINSLPIAL